MEKFKKLDDYDIRTAKERYENLDSVAFVKACNKLSKKTKLPKNFKLQNYSLLDCDTLHIKTVDILEITKEYNNFASKDLKLSVKDLKDIILHKFYYSPMEYSRLFTSLKKQFIRILKDGSNKNGMAYKQCLLILIDHFNENNIFISDTFADFHDDYQKGYYDYYRPMLYSDLSRILFPDKRYYDEMILK